MSATADNGLSRLTALLRTAAQVEHTLLLSYLYAACSLRSTPQEFEKTGNGKINPRRAIQFEIVRGWKQKVVAVAVEEMLHLHYVQCLLRALGEDPCFDLPDRNPNGEWVFPDWLVRNPYSAGTHAAAAIAVGPVTVDGLRRFVAFESTNELQDHDLQGSKIGDRFQSLWEYESDLHLESILLGVADDSRRATLKKALASIYAPSPLPPQEGPSPKPPAPSPVPGSEADFQSIEELYNQGIAPLYEEAFQKGWVVHSNLMLNDELFNPAYAGSTGGRLVPVGPITRSQRFTRLIQKGADDPLRNFKRVEEIIAVILAEGEGMTGFEDRAADLIQLWQTQGTRAYAQGLVAAVASGGRNTPEWMAQWEVLRQSHIYRFGMVLQGLLHEQYYQDDFAPDRAPIAAAGQPGLQEIADELPTQASACYLVLTSWMSRVYETHNWAPDKPRRMAIEMVASWTLMSIAMRPLLELTSLFPCDTTRLFRFDLAAQSSPEAQRLASLYRQPDRTEADNAAMDDAATAVLAGTAAWAQSRLRTMRDAECPDHARKMVMARLRALAQLGEFQKQFPYRVAGGYSDRMPGLEYRQQFPDSARFEEDPFQHKPVSQKPQDAAPIQFPVFADALVLRFRFSGWALAQLSTDPDPAGDETGCTGTTMLHAADGNRRFNQAIIWQPEGIEGAILREPRDKLPEIGVMVREISLMTAAGPAPAGYVPLPSMQLPGALQTAPPQGQLEIEGLLHLLTLGPGDILGPTRRMRVNLTMKDGVPPSYCGLNHLVWQDGEPIDPFILAVTSDPPPVPQGAGSPQDGPTLVLQREVYNQNLSLLEMTPLQRLFSARGPCGLDVKLSSIPDWALPSAERDAFNAGGFPASYLNQRARVLVDALSQKLAAGGSSQQDIDEVVSLAERLAQVTTPKSTTTGWLKFTLHYGHTLSGDLALGGGLSEILAGFTAQTGMELAVSYSGARYASNSRWLVKYALGIMDVDALSNFVYGELFVPVSLQLSGPIRLSESWSFPAATLEAVSAFACQFDHPFWDLYQVNGNTRTLCSASGNVVETLQGTPSPGAYAYSIAGLAGVTSCECGFTAVLRDDLATLTWNVTLECADPGSAIQSLDFLAGAAQKMKAGLAEHFRPKP